MWEEQLMQGILHYHTNELMISVSVSVSVTGIVDYLSHVACNEINLKVAAYPILRVLVQALTVKQSAQNSNHA